MSDVQPPARRYDEDEVRRILERATELQRDLPAAAASQGVTLGELEEIAAEAGIAPGSIRRAARELDSRSEESGAWAAVAGHPPTIVLERTLPGELPEEAFGDLVAEIQRSAGTHGQPSVLGRTLTWQADTWANQRSLQVVVSSRRGETQIRIEERLDQLAGRLFGGIVGGVGGGVGLVGLGVGIGALGSVLFAVAWPVGVAGLSYMGAREIFRTVARGRHRTLAEFLERLTEMVLDHVRSDAGSSEIPPRDTPPGVTFEGPS